jgi:recombination protein U
MAYWGSRGLRGSTLEEMVNITNERYLEHGLALIEKIPTPIKPITLGKESGTITLAYFEKKGSVDYIGVVQGIPICFDAKETSKDYFPLKNIHEHQIAYMQSFEKQEGVAFMLIYFSKQNRYFFLPFRIILNHWQEARRGGRKSIPMSAFDVTLEIKSKSGYLVHYLEALSKYISNNGE